MEYEKIRYPDGQISVKITDFSPPREIKERINSYEDLFFIKSIAEVLEYNGCMEDTFLTIPCMFGQRSDRRFETWQSFDLKIICDFINSCGFENVEVLDPHSLVTPVLLRRGFVISPVSYVQKTIEQIKEYHPNKEIVLVSPDAGAYKRVHEYGARFGLPVLSAVKHRDKDGKIDQTFTGELSGKVALIIDDLLDGGATFQELSKKITQNSGEACYLYITHGYFNKGFDFPYLTKIFTTNSVKDIENEKVIQYKVI